LLIGVAVKKISVLVLSFVDSYKLLII